MSVCLYICVYVFVSVCVFACHSTHVEIRRLLPGEVSFLSLCVLWIKVKLPAALWGKHLYRLSHITGPQNWPFKFYSQGKQLGEVENKPLHLGDYVSETHYVTTKNKKPNFMLKREGDGWRQRAAAHWWKSSLFSLGSVPAQAEDTELRS